MSSTTSLDAMGGARRSCHTLNLSRNVIEWCRYDITFKAKTWKLVSILALLGSEVNWFSERDFG